MPPSLSVNIDKAKAAAEFVSRYEDTEWAGQVLTLAIGEEPNDFGAAMELAAEYLSENPTPDGIEDEEDEPPLMFTYAEGRWVTIGQGEGEGSGGTPVFIEGGEITKGPAAVEDKKISDVDQDKDKPSRKPADTATKAKELEQLANEVGATPGTTGIERSPKRKRLEALKAEVEAAKEDALERAEAGEALREGDYVPLDQDTFSSRDEQLHRGALGKMPVGTILKNAESLTETPEETAAGTGGFSHYEKREDGWYAVEGDGSATLDPKPILGDAAIARLGGAEEPAAEEPAAEEPAAEEPAAEEPAAEEPAEKADVKNPTELTRDTAAAATNARMASARRRLKKMGSREEVNKRGETVTVYDTGKGWEIAGRTIRLGSGEDVLSFSTPSRALAVSELLQENFGFDWADMSFDELNQHAKDNWPGKGTWFQISVGLDGKDSSKRR